MLLPQGARADGCRIIEVYHCSLPNKREEFFFIFFDKHQLSCLYGQTINQNALINKGFVRRQKNIPLGLNYSLNRIIVLKEKKISAFPQLDVQKAALNLSSVGEVAAYLSSGYLGILYRRTTPSDQRAEFQASRNCGSLKS